MADADSSTDADTEERNLMYQNKNVVGSDGSDKSKDQKTLRRLAQNREAARKSRLRKKVYPSTFLNITNIFAPRYGGTKTRRLRKARLKTLILTDAALLKRQKKEIKELRAKLKVYYTAISSLYYSSLHNYIFTTIPIGASMYYSSLLTLFLFFAVSAVLFL